MASMTSVISFLILLLATYSYSAPTITPEYEFTTDTIMVEHQTPANLVLLTGQDSVSVPNLHKSRSFNNVDSEESTTFESQKRGFPESNEESSTIDPVKREFEEFSSTVEPVKREFEEFSSTVEPVKRGLTESSEESSTVDPVKREFEEFSSTVEPVKRGLTESSEESSTVDPVKRSVFEYSTPDMETATTFNGRAIGEEDVKSFDLTTPFYEEQPEAEEHHEPSSSADLEAGQSGLLNVESSSVYPRKPKQPKTKFITTVDLPKGPRIQTIISETSQKEESSKVSSSSSKKTSVTSNGDSNPEDYEKH